MVVGSPVGWDALHTSILETHLFAHEVHLEQFAHHMAADAMVLDEDEETGAKKYRYIRTGEDHFSLAFTYAWMATGRNVCWWIFRPIVIIDSD